MREDETMGQCGCADFHADHVLRLSDGSAVALQIHHCDECTDAIGVVLHHLPQDEVDRWLGANAGTWRAPETTVDRKQIDSTPLIRALDLRRLRERMARFAKKHGKDYDPGGLVQDAVDHAIRPVLHATIAADTASKLGKDGWERVLYVVGSGYDCDEENTGRAWSDRQKHATRRSKREAETRAEEIRAAGIKVRVIRLRPKSEGAST